MKEYEQQKVTLYLSPKYYCGLNLYCKYYNMSYAKAVKGLVQNWLNGDDGSSEMVQAELQREIDRIKQQS